MVNLVKKFREGDLKSVHVPATSCLDSSSWLTVWYEAYQPNALSLMGAFPHGDRLMAAEQTEDEKFY